MIQSRGNIGMKYTLGLFIVHLLSKFTDSVKVPPICLCCFDDLSFHRTSCVNISTYVPHLLRFVNTMFTYDYVICYDFLRL